MEEPNFLNQFGYLLFAFSVFTIIGFLVERKQYLATYTEVYGKLTGQESFLKWIPRLLKYLLIAAGSAFVISAIFFALESL